MAAACDAHPRRCLGANWRGRRRQARLAARLGAHDAMLGGAGEALPALDALGEATTTAATLEAGGVAPGAVSAGASTVVPARPRMHCVGTQPSGVDACGLSTCPARLLPLPPLSAGGTISYPGGPSRRRPDRLPLAARPRRQQRAGCARAFSVRPRWLGVGAGDSRGGAAGTGNCPGGAARRAPAAGAGERE